VRLKAAHHHRVDQHIEVPRCGGVRGAAELQDQLRCVEQLPLQMGQHLPEAPQGFGRYANAHVGQVALQEAPDEVLPLHVRSIFIRGQAAKGEAASQPARLQACKLGDLKFSGEQRREFEARQPALQGFARLAQQITRGRPQQQEVSRAAVGIDFGPQRCEKPGH